MGINGIGVSGHPTSWIARKTQRNLSESDFASRIAAVNAASSGSQTSRKASGDGAIKSTISGRDSYVRETSDFYASGVYTKINLFAVEELDFPIETERYKIEDASCMGNTTAFRIVDKETGRSLYIREDQLMIQKDAKNGLAFVINIDASNAQTWLNRFPSAQLIDTDMDPLNHYNNNGLPDDGSNAASDEQEAETQSRIIVKPDGSRVLMITVDIGGTQTAMSLKISEPTDMQNDYLKQENNPDNMSIPNIGITTDEIPEAAGEK